MNVAERSYSKRRVKKKLGVRKCWTVCEFCVLMVLFCFVVVMATDHRNNQHFIIPELADSSLDLSELAKAAKKKLQAVRQRLRA